jgi:hypothetical protein
MSRLACCCFHKFAHHVVGARAALSPEHVEAPNEFSFLEGDRHQTAKGEIRNYRRFNLASAREPDARALSRRRRFAWQSAKNICT